MLILKNFFYFENFFILWIKRWTPSHLPSAVPMGKRFRSSIVCSKFVRNFRVLND